MTLFITVLIMEILVGAEVDLFVPSFPDLQKTFNLSTFMVELSLGVNLTAYCITALIVGNLGDRYGRKPIINMGFIIFIIGSIFCVFANEYWILLLGRFLQGIGISGAAVLGYLVLADVYTIEQQQRMMGTLNGTITLAMSFAPVIGSYVNLFFSWRGNFVILLILSVLCLILGQLFIKKGESNSKVKISVKEYIPIFKSKKAMYYLATIIFLTQGYWIFIGLSPILYMKALGVSLKEFGIYQGAMSAVFSVMSFSSGYFLKTFGQRRCFFFSIASLIAFLIATLILVIYPTTNPLIITLVTQLISVGMIHPINILWPLLLEAIPDGKARMAALVTSGRLIITVINLQLVSLLYQDSFTPIAIAMGINIIIGLWACYKLFQIETVFSRTAD